MIWRGWLPFPGSIPPTLDLKGLAPGQGAFTQLESYSASAAGIAVHITGDQPVAKFVDWSIPSTFCPEPYINLTPEPGREVRWQYACELYTLPSTPRRRTVRSSLVVRQPR
jgi:hypothetical protein